MALYTIRSQREMANMLNAPKYNPNSQTMWNALGRDAGAQAANGSNDNFFVKRGKSIENAVGTTLAAPASFVYDNMENINTEQLLQDNKTKMNDIAKKYGYNTYQEVWDARDAAEASGDQATLDLIDNTINPQLRAQANTNAQAANEKAAAYDDYRKNNYVSQKINQDRGKFAGSAMNTLSTMADVGLMAAGVPTGALVNSAQGAWEGVADELEQNGEQNFDWGRAGQNAAIGAASGAVTGALNKGLSNAMAKRGGNLLKGGNKLTQAINNFNQNTGLGRTLSTIGTGAARGAVSGAVGGATGAGVSSALQGADVGTGIANALQGAVQGAQQGAVTGGAMAGANLAANAALNKVAPKVANAIQTNQQQNAAYGDKLRDQLKGAWNSGDSVVAENIAKPLIATAAGTIGEATGKINTFAQNVAFQNAIKNPNKVKSPVYLGELTQDDVAGIVEAYKNAGIDLANDPEALSAITVQNGKMYLNQDNAQHIHDSRIVNDGATPKQVRKMFRNATGENSVVSPELTDRGNATMGALRDDGATDISHLSVEDDGTISVKTAYKSKGGKMARQIKNTLGSSELPSTNISGDEGLPGRTSALQGTDDIVPQNGEIVNSQWDTIAQEAGYRTYDDAIRAFADANPNAEINAGAVLTWMDSNQGDWNPNSSRTTAKAQEVPTGKQIKAKREIVKDITDQFEAVDQPTARSTKPNETFYNIYDEWGLSDGDDIRQAVSYAEPGSLVPQMIREAAGEAGVIDLSDAEGLIMDLKINKKNYGKYVNALEDIMDSTDTTIVGGKQGVDALELQRTLEKMASDARGTNGTYHIGNTVVDETMARNFQRIANQIGDKLDEAAVSKGVVQNVLNRHSGDIQQMRDAFANNETWQSAIDNKISGAKTIRDLRSSIRDLTRASIFINNGDERYATFGGRAASKLNTIPTTKAGAVNRVVNDVYDKVRNSATARNIRLAKNADIVRGDQGTASVTPVATVNTAPTTTATVYNPATQIYNAIGRDAGERQGEEQRVAQYLTQAANNQTIAGNTLEGLVAPLGATTSSTSIYDSVAGTTPTTTSVSQLGGSETYFFPPTGDYWADMLSQAMRNAKNAEDYDALGSLYEMYQDALASSQKSSSSSETKLTDKQRQANAAARALQDFEQSESNFGYDVSDIPVLGAIANFGGNEYASKAEALALQIGYMLSGATVNKEEAKNIGMAYVPQPRDSEAVKRSKLQQLRGIISDYQQVYAD